MARDNPAEDRPLPTSIDAECAVLGACLQDPEIAETVLESLRANDLYQDRHKHILGAIRAVMGKGERPDLVTVAKVLSTRRQYDEIGGSTYLAELIDIWCPIPSNYPAYLRLIREAAARRRVIALCTRTVGEMFDESSGLSESIAHHEEDLDVAAHGSDDATAVVPAKLAETIKVWMRQDELGQKPTRIPTHIPKLNLNLGGGMAEGRLYYLGARPSVGKTSFALDIARHAAKAGHAVLVVSLEMPEIDGITTRILSQESLISELSLRSGLLSGEEYHRLVRGAGTLSDLPVWVTEKAHNIVSICRLAERWPFLPRLSLLIVDYLQLVRGPKSESRRVEIEEISRSLKLLAVNISAPVLCISALKRQGEEDREPTMSDLKETGELEYDGDAVLLLHRGFNAEAAKLIIAKNKYGPVGVVPLLFKKACVTFEQAPEEG